MTAFLATHQVDLLRGDTTDAYGDPVDADNVVATDLPASIIEQNRRVFVPAENRMTVVRMYTGRLRPGTDVREGDRLRDRADESIYLVEAVSAPASPIGLADVRVDLRRID